MWPSLLVLHLAAGFGPEITVAPPGPNARAARYQYRPDVASDGTDFVIVWIDKRFEDGTHSTYAARVRGDGLLLDPVGIPLGPLHSDNPRVAWLGGSRYVITWTAPSGVQGRILRTDGTWEAPTFDVGRGDCSDVAGMAGTFAVTWNDGSIRARRYQADGVPFDAVPQLVMPMVGQYACPLIAPGAGNQEWTITWADPGALRAAFLTTGSGPATTTLVTSPLAEIVLRGQVQLPDGRSWAAWSSRSGGDMPLSGMAITPTGPSFPNPILPGDAGLWETAFTLGADGVIRGFASFGQYAQGGFAELHLSLDGGTPLPGPSARVNPGGEPALAASSDRLLRVTSKDDEIFYVLADQAFTVIDAGIASMSGASQTDLALAASGASYLAVWSEHAGLSSNVIARRLDADAMPVGASLVLSATDTGAHSPSVAFAKNTWAAAWDDDDGARFQLLTEPGARGAGGKVVQGASDTQMPHVIADGLRFAIVFVSNDDAAVYFSALELDGGLSSTSRVAAVPSGFPYLPRIARGDGGFLVAWQQNDDVYGARLDAVGASLDPMGFVIVGGDEVQLQPQVAFDGEAFVVSYRGYSHPKYVRVSGTQVSAPLVPFTPGSIGTMRRTALVSQPGGVLATACDTSAGNVVARLISPSGGGLDAGPELGVAASPPFACEPAVTGVGNVLFGYGRFETAPQAMSAKVRLHSGAAKGETCTESWRCATGLCSSGVCVLPPAGTGGGSGAGGGAGGSGGGSTATGGGSETGGPGALGIGCGCSSGSVPLLLALLGLAWSRRRGRRAT